MKNRKYTFIINTFILFLLLGCQNTHQKEGVNAPTKQQVLKVTEEESQPTPSEGKVVKLVNPVEPENLIKEYYSLLSKDLEKAYSMKVEDSTSFQTFQNWYNNTEYARPKNIQQIGENTYSFLVEYKEINNEFIAEYFVKMSIVNGKLNTHSSIQTNPQNITNTPIKVKNNEITYVYKNTEYTFPIENIPNDKSIMFGEINTIKINFLNKEKIIEDQYADHILLENGLYSLWFLNKGTENIYKYDFDTPFTNYKPVKDYINNTSIEKEYDSQINHGIQLHKIENNTAIFNIWKLNKGIYGEISVGYIQPHSILDSNEEWKKSGVLIDSFTVEGILHE